MGEYWGVESGVGIGLLWHKFQWKDESKESKWKQHTLMGRCVSTNIYHQSLIDYVITYWFAYIWCAASYPLSSCWYDDVLWFHPLPSTSLLISPSHQSQSTSINSSMAVGENWYAARCSGDFIAQHMTISMPIQPCQFTIHLHVVVPVLFHHCLYQRWRLV